MANKGKCWNAKIETMPKNEMANLQLVKLKKQLQYNYKNSLFSAGWRVRSVLGLQTKKMGKPNHWFAHFNKRRYFDVKKKGYF